jgi:hypothetical protein
MNQVKARRFEIKAAAILNKGTLLAGKNHSKRGAVIFNSA